MVYVLIKGPSYNNMPFEAREQVRENLRDRLESYGICFVQYDWVWDTEDRCLLLVGQYERIADAYWWIRALETMDFKICIRSRLFGDVSRTGTYSRSPTMSLT